MSDLPFILHVSRPDANTNNPLIDLPATDDPLPAVLEINGMGFVKERTTKITDVDRETTDDE